MYNIWEVVKGRAVLNTTILMPVSVVESNIATFEEAKTILSKQTKRCVIVERHNAKSPDPTVVWKVIFE